MVPNVLLFKNRRRNLINRVKAFKEQDNNPGIVVFMAGFEEEAAVMPFRQNKNFLYFVGSQESGVILCSYSDGREILYIPHYPLSRSQWVTGGIKITDDPQLYGVDEIRYLGQEEKDYSCYFLRKKERYDTIIRDLQAAACSGYKLFSVTGKSLKGTPKELQKKEPSNPDLTTHLAACQLSVQNSCATESTVLLWQWFLAWEPALIPVLYDASYEAHDLRRIKDEYELSSIRKAITITLEAQRAVENVIQEGCYEYEGKAALEYVFLKNNTYCSFPSIVATGKNATILHYTDNNARMKTGELVVVDIGAEYQGYAADITRTYAVGGTKTARQQELYDLVLATQTYIASCAQPGYYLKNINRPEESLHHLAVAYLKERGYDRYFVHGIGHYLGLNVHDVGDYATPLRPGDVFTIEPGIYIPEESIGIRIEDNYLITDSGCERLSL